jgi:hypothetical protein
MLIRPNFDPNNTFTIFVARYNGNPELQNVNAVSYYDVRVTGAEPGWRLVVTFRYDTTAGVNPQLMYYSPAAGSYLPVISSQLNLAGIVIDPQAGTITLTFDASSEPALTALGGTVFAIVVTPVPQGPSPSGPSSPAPTPTVVTTSLTPDLALALPAKQNSLVLENQRTVQFQTSSELTTAVASVQDSASLTSNHGGRDDEEEEPEGEPIDEAPIQRLLQQAIEGLMQLLRRNGFGKPPAAEAPGAPPAAPAATGAAEDSNSESRLNLTLDAFFADHDWSVPIEPIPQFLPSDGELPSEERFGDLSGAAAALLATAGSGVVAGRHVQRSRRRSQRALVVD